MIIHYNDKIYNYKNEEYISLHHCIIDFYEKHLKNELHYFKNIYISHILYNKEYILSNEKEEELNKDTLIYDKDVDFSKSVATFCSSGAKKVVTIFLKINHNEKYIFELLTPYIKVLIISLLIIIRIDIFLSTSYNNHIKSFEDYYILLLYVFTILIIILIFYYSYKVIIRFIEYVIQNLDKDIGVFMGSYIESYNIMDSYNYNVNNVDNYVNKCKNFLIKIENEEEEKRKIVKE
jgi:hypothetical protein